MRKCRRICRCGNSSSSTPLHYVPTAIQQVVVANRTPVSTPYKSILLSVTIFARPLAQLPDVCSELVHTAYEVLENDIGSVITPLAPLTVPHCSHFPIAR